MNNKNLTNDQVLCQFPLELRKNIQEILSGTLGLSPRPVKIIPSNKIYKQHSGINYVDTFTLEIPYAGMMLQWEVIFNMEDIYFAPDFYFKDDFLRDPDIDVIEKHVPTLARWNLDDSQALITVLREFLVLYKDHQMEKLRDERKFVNYYKEYLTLLEKSNYYERNVEVHIDNHDAVHFLIVMSVDGKDLPTYMQPIMYSREEDRILNPGEDAGVLKITFLPQRVLSNLTLSPRLEQHLGNAQSLNIPAYHKESGLIEYVSNIESLLKDRIKEIEKYYKLKSKFISTLLSEQGLSVTEYDNVQFNYAALLLEVDDFYCLVHVSVSPKFPSEPPQILLRSIYHETNGKPIKQLLEGYPYSPRWSAGEMVSRILRALYEEIPRFQAMCRRQF